MVTCRRGERHAGPAVIMTGRVPSRDADRVPDHSRGWRRVAVPGERPGPLLELVVIAVMFGAYKLGRIVAAKHVGTAFDNAYVVWDLERLLRLPDELSVQALMMHNAVVIRSANVYYAAVHFPATAAFLIWLYLRRPGDYLWVRRTLALLTASGLLVHLAIPVAPPRMLSTLGFVDTAAIYGPAVYGPPNQNTLADQYAAMPSLHIGWAVVVAIGIIATSRTRWRWLAVLHPTLTTLVVIGTANHYWLDGMVALGLLAASLTVVRSISEPRVDVPDFVPVLASPAVRELPDLPNRMPPPQRRIPATARRPLVIPVLGAPLLVAPHLVAADRRSPDGNGSADRRGPDGNGSAGRRRPGRHGLGSGAGGEDLADVAGDCRDR